MGSNKSICFTCKKSFSGLHQTEKCQECGGDLILYPHRFRPPAKTNLNGWKVVRFLYDHGFAYQHILEEATVNHKNITYYVKYPDDMIDAKDFVIKYKNQALRQQK